MAQIIRLRGNAQPAPRPSAGERFDLRGGLLIAALVTVIALATGAVAYVSLPRTPANITAGSSTPDVSDDSAVYDPHAAEARQQVRRAEQEKEDSAVFGQAPSAAAYQSLPR